jgi:hypothetical protein
MASGGSRKVRFVWRQLESIQSFCKCDDTLTQLYNPPCSYIKHKKDGLRQVQAPSQRFSISTLSYDTLVPVAVGEQ